MKKIAIMRNVRNVIKLTIIFASFSLLDEMALINTKNMCIRRSKDFPNFVLMIYN